MSKFPPHKHVNLCPAAPCVQGEEGALQERLPRSQTVDDYRLHPPHHRCCDYTFTSCVCR